MDRLSSEWIKELDENEIFVFGSNEGGKHGAGAAKMAMKWGARYGQAKGLMGKTYGIPTVDSTVKKTLSVQKIKVYVDEFITFAKTKPQLKFLVTEVGCGLAGLSVKEIAPLFKSALALSNVYLPKSFVRVLSNRLL